MNIVYVFADNLLEWNSSEWRCAIPARAINRTQRHHADMLSISDFARNTPASQAVCSAADVIVVQRNLFGLVLSAIQHWKARDKILVADFDDAYQLMPSSNASYPFWGQGLVLRAGAPPEKLEPHPLKQFEWGLRLVHAATVPSLRLADDWRAYTSVHYLPNYIELRNYTDVTAEPHEGIIIGWGGSLSHYQSFSGSGVLMALKRVCQARPQVRVMVCGDDRRIFEQLALPESQKVHQPWGHYSEWPRTLSRFDIGIAPLYGAYDERRSWIKPLEYMVMKIPWAASDSPAYQDLRNYGWLVKNTPAGWERVLMDMVDNLDEYKNTAAGEPYLFGISQSIDDNVENVITAYASIRESVTAADFRFPLEISGQSMQQAVVPAR